MRYNVETIILENINLRKSLLIEEELIVENILQNMWNKFTKWINNKADQKEQIEICREKIKQIKELLDDKKSQDSKIEVLNKLNSAERLLTALEVNKNNNKYLASLFIISFGLSSILTLLSMSAPMLITGTLALIASILTTCCTVDQFTDQISKKEFDETILNIQNKIESAIEATNNQKSNKKAI